MQGYETYTDAVVRARDGSESLNVGTTERWLSLLGGGVLALRGVARGGGGGLLQALVGGALLYRGVTGHCPAYGALGVSTARPAARGGLRGLAGPREIHLLGAVTIGRSAIDLYRFWRNVENLPRVMAYVESVTAITASRSRWVVKGPLETRLQWESEITDDREGEAIAWRSVAEADLSHAGEVRFWPLPGDRGCEVRLKLDIAPPAGAAGAAAARWLRGLTEQLLHEDLRRFKRLMETGEIPTIDGQPRGGA